jgi:hypothetical protein
MRRLPPPKKLLRSETRYFLIVFCGFAARNNQKITRFAPSPLLQRGEAANFSKRATFFVSINIILHKKSPNSR